MIDYAFHMIIADPTQEILRGRFPPLSSRAMGSMKVFMTYDRPAGG